MKKFLVSILLIITTAGTIIPCCAADDCCEVEMKAKDEQNNQSDGGACSPFFACATCSGFVASSKVIQLYTPAITKQIHQEVLVKSSLPDYSATCWQPPRVG